MPPFWIMIAILALATGGLLLGRSRSIRMVEGNTRILHSRPSYHGWNVALFTALPALVLLAFASFLGAPGWLVWGALALALAGFAFSLSRITRDFRARNVVEPVSYTHLTLPTNREV